MPETSAPFATVIVVTFNSEATIRATLESLARQTVPDLEVIVVDDGSTDGTVELVESCMPAVRLVRQPNMGVAVARNHGISLSSGHWVAVLDADDLWAPTRLEEFAEYIRRVPACEAMATDVLEFAASEDVTLLRACGEEPHFVAPRDGLEEAALRFAGARQESPATWARVDVLRREDLLRRYPIRSPAFLVRRDTIMRAGLFQPSAAGVSDMVLAMNLASITAIHHLRHQGGHSTALYRLDPGSISQSTDMGLLVLAQLVGQHFGSIRQPGQPNLALRRDAARHYRNVFVGDSLRFAVRRREWWRWHAAVGLGYALMADPEGRIKVLRLAARTVAETARGALPARSS